MPAVSPQESSQPKDSTSTLPRVALLGRPNVGKSTLFNRLIGKRQAVISDIPGTTRDRLERPLIWNNASFVLVDMAGIEPALKEANEISQGVQQQVERALQDAALIVWVVDSAVGITTQDERVAEILRRLNRPVLVAANKCDDPSHEIRQFEFSRFGFPSIPLSALHGRGADTLLDAISERLKTIPEAQVSTLEENDRELRLAILGRPNVGKSTLLNALLGDYRSVVSATAGTTRDAVDTVISATKLFGRTFTRWQTVRIIDTAGIRRRGKIGHSIEEWSVLRTYISLEDADIAILMLDGNEPLVHQDLQVANRIVEAGRGFIIAVNKWDEVLEKEGIIPGTPEDEEQQNKLLDQMRRTAPFLHFCPVLFLSAKTGLHLDQLGRLILNTYIAWSREPSQEQLDELSNHLKTLPRLTHLRRITLEHSKPPTFKVITHGSFLLHFSTRRQVEHAIRDFCDIGPTPIKIWVERVKN